MQTNLAYQIEDQNEAFQTALIRLGERWPAGATTAFSTSFVTQLPSVYSHLLSAWPDGAGPEKSLELLSADIAGQLRPTAERFGIDTFGLSLSSQTEDVEENLPFLLLYDLERGLRVPLTEAERLFMPERALWVGYAPLDEEDIERFLAHQKQQEAEPPSEKILENLQAWQRNFSHTLALAQADAAMSMEAQTSLLGLLKQGRSLQGAVMLTQSKTSTGKGKTDVKAETQKMRTAIVKQLANGALPEAMRAALRLSLRQLDKAAGEKPMAWKYKSPGKNGHVPATNKPNIDRVRANTVKGKPSSTIRSKVSVLLLFKKAMRGATMNPRRGVLSVSFARTQQPLIQKKNVEKVVHKTEKARGPNSWTAQSKIPTSQVITRILQRPLQKTVTFIKRALHVVAALPLVQHIGLVRTTSMVSKAIHGIAIVKATRAQTDPAKTTKGFTSVSTQAQLTKHVFKASRVQPIKSQAKMGDVSVPSQKERPTILSPLSNLGQTKSPISSLRVSEKARPADAPSQRENPKIHEDSTKTRQGQTAPENKPDKTAFQPMFHATHTNEDQRGGFSRNEQASPKIDLTKSASIQAAIKQDFASKAVPVMPPNVPHTAVQNSPQSSPKTAPVNMVKEAPPRQDTIPKQDVPSTHSPTSKTEPVVEQQPVSKQEAVASPSPTETVAHDFSKVDFQSMGIDLGGFSSLQSDATPLTKTISAMDLKIATDLQDKTSKSFEVKLSEAKDENTQNEKKGAKISPHRCSDPFCVCHMAAPGPK